MNNNPHRGNFMGGSWALTLRTQLIARSASISSKFVLTSSGCASRPPATSPATSSGWAGGSWAAIPGGPVLPHPGQWGRLNRPALLRLCPSWTGLLYSTIKPPPAPRCAISSGIFGLERGAARRDPFSPARRRHRCRTRVGAGCGSRGANQAHRHSS